MRLHRLRPVLLAALLAAPGLAQADEDQTIGTFVSSCFQHLGKSEELTARLDAIAQRLEGAPAQQFLDGQPGRAWLLAHDEGVYGFALTEPDTCTMTAISGDPETIAADFMLFGKMAEDGYTVEWKPVTHKAGWDQHAYTLDPHAPATLHLRLRVNNASNAPVRAIVSVGVIGGTTP